MTTARDYRRDGKRDRSMGMEEAAEFLGVAKGTLYNLVSRELIKHYKIGRKVVFRESELTEYMERRAVDSIGDAGGA